MWPFNKKTTTPLTGIEAVFKPGTEYVLEAPSPSGPFMAVFEDDGTTGYFYGLDTRRSDNPIVDALHIYNCASVADWALDSRFRITWTRDGEKVLLLINEYPHAAFDFNRNRGYCRTGFPPSAQGFSAEGHDWSDSILAAFK